jgi:ABC-type dipeptide/oligopeptide/nickel transport system permease component
MTANGPVAENRLERVLGFMIFGIVGLSVICFLAIIIGTAAGMQRADFASGIWPMVSVIPFVGLPLAMILLVALFLVVARRRGRAAKDAVQ